MPRPQESESGLSAARLEHSYEMTDFTERFYLENDLFRFFEIVGQYFPQLMLITELSYFFLV